MAKGQKSQLVTKKHLARQQREKLQNRYILIASLAIIVIVVGLIGYGVLQQYVLQPQQPVAKVANDVVTTKQFQTFARWTRMQLIQQYQQYEQFAQYFGSDQTSLSYIQQYMAQISYQLESTNLGQSTLDYLIAAQLVQQEADKQGIKVTDAEVDTALQDYFSYYPNGTPTATATSVVTPTATLDATQLFLVPPTSTPRPTSTFTPTPVITSTQALESPTPTTEITSTAVGPTGTPLPTATPYTLDAYMKDFSTYVTNINSFAGLSESDLRWIFHMRLLREKVFNALTADANRNQDQVWTRHIVVSTEANAQSVYARLENGGDFTTIATEVMTSTTTTVDLGWLDKNSLESTAADVVYAMKVGEISKPFQTTAGWEVYQLLGHEVRALSDSQFDQLKQAKFSDWIDQQKILENVQTFDIWRARVPASPTIPPTQTG